MSSKASLENDTRIPSIVQPRRWSIGVFASTGTQLPRACLERCLDGDPSLAGTRGCAMLKSLVAQGDTDSPPAEDRAPAPAVCGQGYAVSLLDSDGAGAPAVLILHPPIHKGSTIEAIKPAIEILREKVTGEWNLNQENHGLAEEVLRTYEQINLIFDVSGEIAILTNADDVRGMLLTKLRSMFDADAVYCSSHDGRSAAVVTADDQIRRAAQVDDLPSATMSPPTDNARRFKRTVDQPIAFPPEFEDASDRLRQSKRVFVASRDSDEASSGHGTSMWGALRDGETTFFLMGIVRRNRPFASGDMLVLDSVLTYGGHILSNLRLVEQLKRTSFEAVRALVNAIDQKDSYTFGHSERVGLLARATGQTMGLPPERLQELEWAGLLHDVGKIGIPESVLNKPGKLTKAEFGLIKEHPSRGYDILRPVASLQPILDGVLHHHENPDGTGYPDGLKRDETSLMARMIHVVDVFDALTSTRSYRSAFETDRAIEILNQDAGTKLDAAIVECFLRTWRNLPRTQPRQYERWFGASKEVPG